MSTKQNKALIQRAADAFNAGDWDGYFSMYDENVRVYGFPPGLAPGLGGLRQFYGAFDAAFTDPDFQVEEFVAEGECLALRYVLRATHTGSFMGADPTGRRIEMRGITLLHFQNGKVVERWQAMDDLGFLQQLGALPELTPA